MTEMPPPDLVALAAFQPTFDAPDFDFGHWETPGADATGVLHLPYYSLGSGGLALVRLLGQGNWVTPAANWTEWAKTDEAQRLATDPAAVAVATAEDLQRLATTIVRSNRFNEGALASAYESGLLARILRRAVELASQ